MLNSYFKISERGSSVGQEIRGGVVTFFTMAYIVALNPLIIGLAKDGDGKFLGGGDAPNLALVAAATALVAGDRKSTRLNSSHVSESRMPSSA